MDVEFLRDQHARIVELSGQLARAVASPQPVTVSTIRWRLARELIAHLTLEDARFYPWARAQADAELQQCADEYQATMGGLATTFKTYIAEWDEARMASDWPGFRRETGMLLEEIGRRMHREETVLYPLAERVPLRRAG